ncbi:MAG: HAMP domain-containing protein [Desulfovibrio sp.]|jgi:two-component system nitrogen regulation sensor histidine kinase NtrY|nr:HAMP domain-containing protein [Desulfovibrio sp.]
MDARTDAPEAVTDELSLSAHEARERERKRRRRELLFAALAFLLVLLLTWLQLEQFRAGDSLFVVMFNVNFVLLISVLLIVLRNGFKLLLERRRGLLGSGLRARLVLAFVGLSLLPCLLMFLITTKYVQLSMDFWFKQQIESSMDAALVIAGDVYERTGQALLRQSEKIKAETRGLAWTQASGAETLKEKCLEYGNALAGIHDAGDGKTLALVGDADVDTWKQALAKFDAGKIKQQGYDLALVSTPDQDYLFAAVALEGDLRLITSAALGEGFASGTERIVRGSREYGHLRNIKNPLKLMLYSSLGVLTALIILGAVWFGFRLAREMSAPIFALASGTDRIAGGDLSVRLADNAKDEFGMLIRSFNRMATDLETSRRETTEAYMLLERQNQEIARHGKYMETVLDNIAAGVISFDAQGHIFTINKAASDILGMEPQTILGRRIEDFMPEAYGNMAKDLRERFSRRVESRARHSLGLTLGGEEKRLLLNVVGFSAEGVYSGAVAVFEDITELERMQRMAAWREVARRIAHEIKNPLTPIKLSAQRLAKKFGKEVNDPVFIEGTELIVRQVEHLLSMVQEFSAFAKLPEVKPQPGDILPLIKTVTDLFRTSHSGIKWELSAPDCLPEIPMDKEALNRAFMNILGNAADALNQGKTQTPTVRVSVSHQPSLNLLRIDVEDNGPGLTDEERSRLFEPYFSRKKGGTGLGLTIVRSIISDHRGYVRALHNEGAGTVISMELPLA